MFESASANTMYYYNHKILSNIRQSTYIFNKKNQLKMFMAMLTSKIVLIDPYIVYIENHLKCYTLILKCY